MERSAFLGHSEREHREKYHSVLSHGYPKVIFIQTCRKGEVSEQNPPVGLPSLVEAFLTLENGRDRFQALPKDHIELPYLLNPVKVT